jgi:ABC-type lipoprotein release transport system permease subunit
VELVLGIAGVVVMVVAAVALREVEKPRPRLLVQLLGLVGWAMVTHFLIARLVPSDVVAYVVLGGITLAVLAAAVVGARKARREGRSAAPTERHQP